MLRTAGFPSVEVLACQLRSHTGLPHGCATRARFAALPRLKTCGTEADLNEVSGNLLPHDRSYAVPPDESLPSEQEKAVAAKRAVVGLKKPLQSRLQGIAGAYAPEIDGSAMRAACGEEPYSSAHHEPASGFSAPVASGPARFGDGAE